MFTFTPNATQQQVCDNFSSAHVTVATRATRTPHVSVKRTLTLLFGSLLLSACSIFQPKPVIPEGNALSQQQAETLTALVNWSVSGKLGYRLPDEAGSAFLDWTQADKQYDIHLSGPLNIGAVTIEGTPDAATITAGKETHQTHAPEFLFYDMLGWPLPIRDITWWIKGLPAPGAHEASYDDYGLLKTLKQRAWDVAYINYSKIDYDSAESDTADSDTAELTSDGELTQNHLYLPRKIIATRDHIRLTFVLKRWQLSHGAQ